MTRLSSCLLTAAFLFANVVQESHAQSNADNELAPDTTQAGKLSWSVLPIVFSQPETGLAFGVLPQIVFNTRGSVRPSQVYLALFYTMKSQYGAYLSSTVWLNEDRDNIEIEANLLHWPTLYYGIGSDGLKATPENYTQDQSGISVTGKHLFSRTLFGGLTAATLHQKLTDLDFGGDIENGLVPGSDGGRVLGLGPVIGYDSRNHNLFPTRGQLIELRLVKYGGLLGGDYDYTQLVIDARTYHRLAQNHTLALQAYVSDNGENVPFWMMEGVGSIVRGFQDTKFIDRTLVAGQIEYRLIPAYRRLGFTVFAGAGTVAPTLSKIPDGHIRWAAGIGIRFKVVPDALINIRLDLAFGTDASEVYFEIGEAF